MSKKTTANSMPEDQPLQDLNSSVNPQTDSLSDTIASQPPQALAVKVSELTNDLQRTRADFENFRKQTEIQKSQAMSVARYATVQKFLPLLDDFDRAIEAYPTQLAPLRKSLDKLMKELKLAKINSSPDTEFNPDYHDAISVEDAGGDVEVVAETLRPGYLYEDEVIRPAMVKVKTVAE